MARASACRGRWHNMQQATARRVAANVTSATKTCPFSPDSHGLEPPCSPPGEGPALPSVTSPVSAFSATPLRATLTTPCRASLMPLTFAMRPARPRSMSDLPGPSLRWLASFRTCRSSGGAKDTTYRPCRGPETSFTAMGGTPQSAWLEISCCIAICSSCSSAGSAARLSNDTFRTSTSNATAFLPAPMAGSVTEACGELVYTSATPVGVAPLDDADIARISSPSCERASSVPFW
mmetsp:Transcript_6244/g.17008  ORF Transcript_6244/g.17008 Transcript_6244/m.17008 type:complete len:235 (-) Transcript_6244:522-1226(-)